MGGGCIAGKRRRVYFSKINTALPEVGANELLWSGGTTYESAHVTDFFCWLDLLRVSFLLAVFFLLLFD